MIPSVCLLCTVFLFHANDRLILLSLQAKDSSTDTQSKIRAQYTSWTILYYLWLLIPSHACVLLQMLQFLFMIIDIDRNGAQRPSRRLLTVCSPCYHFLMLSECREVSLHARYHRERRALELFLLHTGWFRRGQEARSAGEAVGNTASSSCVGKPAPRLCKDGFCWCVSPF